MSGRHHKSRKQQHEKYWQSRLTMQFKFQRAHKLLTKVLFNCIFPKKYAFLKFVPCLSIYVTTVCVYMSAVKSSIWKSERIGIPLDICLYPREISLWLDGRIYWKCWAKLTYNNLIVMSCTPDHLTSGCCPFSVTIFLTFYKCYYLQGHKSGLQNEAGEARAC